MAYQVLARKWRPKLFRDLVGQGHVVGALTNALTQGRLHHAYLLTGTRGVGKTTIARILAKRLNCENPQGAEPCGQCRSCQEIDQNRFVDLLEIDAASNTGIDNIREVLENAQYSPTAGRYKVYIIDEVHMLSKQAFNAMLKTLEEPPEHVKFILATTDPHKVPITVLSRCLQFVLRHLTIQQISHHLQYILTEEQIKFSTKALELIGRSASGSMRDALSLLDQSIALGSGSVNEESVRQMLGVVDKHYLFDLLSAICSTDKVRVHQVISEMNTHAVGFDHVLAELATLLQEIAVLQTLPSTSASTEILALASQMNAEQVQLYYQCCIYGKKDLPLAPDEYAGFMMTIVRMLAFAPLTATTPNQTIHGTELHNPQPVVTRLPENNSSENNLAQPEENNTPPENNSSENNLAQPEENNTPPENNSSENNLAQPEENNTLPENNSSENNLAQSEENNTPPEKLNNNKNDNTLPLDKEHWSDIVYAITGQLTMATGLAEHCAFVKQDNHTLVLALDSKGQIHQSDNNINKLEQVLINIYNLDKVIFQEWEQGMQSARAIREAKIQTQRLQNQKDLETDPIAQILQNRLGGEWVIIE